MHQLLSTLAKLHRMGAVRSAQCKTVDYLEDGTMEHELLQCNKNDGVGILLVSCLQQHVQDIDHNRVLRLEFAGASIQKVQVQSRN